MLVVNHDVRVLHEFFSGIEMNYSGGGRLIIYRYVRKNGCVVGDDACVDYILQNPLFHSLIIYIIGHGKVNDRSQGDKSQW